MHHHLISARNTFILLPLPVDQLLTRPKTSYANDALVLYPTATPMRTSQGMLTISFTSTTYMMIGFVQFCY